MCSNDPTSIMAERHPIPCPAIHFEPENKCPRPPLDYPYEQKFYERSGHGSNPARREDQVHGPSHVQCGAHGKRGPLHPSHRGGDRQACRECRVPRRRASHPARDRFACCASRRPRPGRWRVCGHRDAGLRRALHRKEVPLLSQCHRIALHPQGSRLLLRPKELCHLHLHVGPSRAGACALRAGNHVP